MPNKKKYNSEHHDDWAWSLAVKGATDAEIADAMGISRKTIYKWSYKWDENDEKIPDENGEPILSSFGEALIEGKNIADSKVERSLYKSSTGYTVKKTKKMVAFYKDGNIMPVRSEETVRYIPPNATSQIFWLKNRKKEQWRDVTRNEVAGADGEPVKVQQVQIILPEKEAAE